jgi:hypothetical protein
MTSFTDHQRLRTVRASRRRARGAAFVESLIVISLILLCLWGTLFLKFIYSTKLASIQAARNKAWSAAVGGCKPPPVKAISDDATHRSETDGADSTSDSSEGQIAGLTADTTQDTPQWLSLQDGGDATEGLPGGKNFDGSGLSIVTTRKILCNEKGGNDELDLSAGDLLSEISTVIHDLFN